jgi:glycosyltransferase involved in cell wall biosynthesis
VTGTASRAVPADQPAVHAGRPRRVCLVIGQLGLGGAEQQIALLAVGLKQRGIDVTVVALMRGGPREAILQKAGVPVIKMSLAGRVSWLFGGKTLAAVCRLAVLFRRLRPDVVHAYLLHSHLLVVPAARVARVPLVVASKRNLADSRFAFRRSFAVLERLAVRAADVVIANSRAAANDAVRRDGLPAERVFVSYNALQESSFASADPAYVKTELPVVLCVANLHRYKGHRNMLDAVDQLKRRGRPCTLVLAGDGRERDAVRDQAHTLGLDVRMLGARTDIDALLARADVVVLPTLTESLSIGLAELLAEGRGLLVQPANAAALADGIEQMLANPASARRIAARGRQWSRTTFAVDRLVDEHLAIYGDHLEGR